MQGRARGGRGGGGGYHYRSHGFQPYAAAGGGWQAYGGGGGYNHHMQHGGGGGGGGGGGYGPVYAHRGALPLGVQGAGILKRPTGSPQGPLLHGRGHHHRGGRGGGGRGGRGGRGRGRNGRDKEKDQKPLTKEALDADLDEWRMKDKKNGGTSLDAELDDYWKDNKEDDPTDKDDGELLETAPAEEPAAAKPETPKSTKKSSGARPLDRGNGEAPEPSTNGAA